MEELLNQIRAEYPFLKIWAFESPLKIELQQIEIPVEHRGGGIGSIVMKRLQSYARSVGKPIVLRPEAERGRKKDLERFYKGLGFVDNKGRHMDYSLSSPMAKTMYWRFKEWLRESVGEIGIRYIHNDGRGLMNNSSLNYDKLDDDEAADVEDEYLGLSQPPSSLHNQEVIFVFTVDGERRHSRLIELLTKASKRGVRREQIDLSSYRVIWDSGDGQLGLVRV